jgi:hypothetical protein
MFVMQLLPLSAAKVYPVIPGYISSTTMMILLEAVRPSAISTLETNALARRGNLNAVCLTLLVNTDKVTPSWDTRRIGLVIDALG